MKDGAYRKRVERDLDRWIEAKLVPAGNRSDILRTLPKANTGDGVGWLALAGFLLAGLAIIAFIADNWAEIPRIGRLALLMSCLFGSMLGAAFTANTHRRVSNGLCLLSSLVFASSAALLGQTFNMPGEPSAVLFWSAIAAASIGLAGRSTAASFAALVFSGLWMWNVTEGLSVGWMNLSFWGINLIVIPVGLIAWQQRSRALWRGLIVFSAALSFFHMLEIASLLSGNGLDYTRNWHDSRTMSGILFASMTLLWTALSGYGVHRDQASLPGGRTLAGYGAYIAFGNLLLLGIPMSPEANILHKVLCLGAAFAGIWFGAKYRYGAIIAASVLALMATIAIILFDLGMDLSSAALLFGLTACISLSVVFLVHRNNRKETAE